MNTKRAMNPLTHPTTRRMALAGLVAGSGLGSIVSAIRSMRMQRRLEKMREDMDRSKADSMDNTIVLRLPPSAAAEKMANTPSTAAASMLAALAGAGVGYGAVRSFAQAALMRKLKEEEEAAHSKFLEQLPGYTLPTKVAAIVNDVLVAAGVPEGKQASSSFGPGDLALGSLMAMGLLGMGTSAYATKRYLDANYAEQRRKYMKPQKVTRVIFASDPAQEGAVDAEEAKVAHDTMRAAVSAQVLVAKGYGLDKIASVVEAAAASGWDREALRELTEDLAAFHKDAQVAAAPAGNHGVADMITGVLDQNKPLRDALIREGMKASPMLNMLGRPGQWAATNVPGISHLAKRQLYSRVRGAFAPKPPAAPMAPKTAFSRPGEGGLATSILGSSLAEVITRPDRAPADEPNAQAEVAVVPEAVPADPAAAAYVAANKEKVRRILEAIAATPTPV